MKMLAASIATLALALTGAACSSSSGEASDCTGEADPGGPIGGCKLAFSCDSGSYGISCTMSGSQFECRCTDAAGSQGQPFAVQTLPCTTEEALPVVNGYCDFGLTLAQ
jgi:hypothetical protein